MAIENFQQTIWSRKIQKQLETITSLKDHCDFQFQGDVKLAEKVKILGVKRPTIRTYIPGTKLVREGGTDESQYLEINQYRYFDFEVEDIDQAQSVPGLIEALSSEATAGLSEEADKYVASLVKTNLASLDKHGYSLATGEHVKEVEKGFAKLYKNNCKVTDNFYYEVCPDLYTGLRPQLTELYTDNPEMIKKGILGRLNNAYITLENLLETGTIDTKACTLNMLRTTKAIAFAGQIDKVEAYRPHDAFQDALKGLYVFGAKIVRPEQIYVIGTYA